MKEDTITQAGRARDWFKKLQEEICTAIEGVDGAARFEIDNWAHETGGGGSTRVLANGRVIEKGGVNFSNVLGDSLPAAASKAHPELGGRSFEAMGVSVVMHPRNPRSPTSHMNVRYFTTTDIDGEPVWWFGGGFDLTPYYPREEDVVHWHRVAQEICRAYGDTRYRDLKKRCDEYFICRIAMRLVALAAFSLTIIMTMALIVVLICKSRWIRISRRLHSYR